MGASARCEGDQREFRSRFRALRGNDRFGWQRALFERLELWTPLWQRPSRWVEIAALLAEGRMQIGKRRAGDTLEMARAATSLGVDRGIAEFVRYPILQRNGRSYFAFAIGRFCAGQRPESELVGSLERPLGQLDRVIRMDKNTPVRVLAARRTVSAAMFDALHGRGEARALELLRAIGRLDKAVALWSGGREIEPLAGLSPGWLEQVDSHELRIAAAIASIRGGHGVGPFRSNLIGVDADEPKKKWATGTGQRAWRGATLPDRLANVLRRRLLDASKEKREGNPIHGVVTASADQIAAFIEDESGDGAIEELIHAMTWIDWEAAPRVVGRLGWWRRASKHDRLMPPRTYALLKLCFWQSPTAIDAAKQDGERIAPEPTLIPLLLAGRLDEACRVAQRRLRGHGFDVLDLASTIETIRTQRSFCARLAGSLLIPMSSADSLIEAVTLPQRKEENDR